jgi:DNA invertase Pin-like site-specific DNA recombinase
MKDESVGFPFGKHMAGRLVFYIFGALANIERSLIHEQIIAGLRAACL